MVGSRPYVALHFSLVLLLQRGNLLSQELVFLAKRYELLLELLVGDFAQFRLGGEVVGGLNLLLGLVGLHFLVNLRI